MSIFIIVGSCPTTHWLKFCRARSCFPLMECSHCALGDVVGECVKRHIETVGYFAECFYGGVSSSCFYPIQVRGFEVATKSQLYLRQIGSHSQLLYTNANPNGYFFFTWHIVDYQRFTPPLLCIFISKMIIFVCVCKNTLLLLQMNYNIW